MDKILPIVIIFVLITGVFMWSRARQSLLPAQEAKQKVENGALLIDVRTPGEFSGGHIKGAVNVPLSEIGAKLDAFGDTDTEIVLYCRSGNRSGQAMRFLQGKGYQNVHNLGPMSAW